MRRQRRIMAGGAALVAALALGGCSAMGGGASDEAPTVIDGRAFPEARDDGVVTDRDVSGGAGEDDVSGGAGEDDVAVENRSVIVKGAMSVTVDDPIAAARDAVRIVELAGGRVDGRTEYAPTETTGGSARLELRIPADELTDTVDELRDLGRADEVSLSSTDVTVQVQDLDARIDALRASLDRLRSLMAQASDIDDLIKLESEISNRQGQLESLEAQQRYYADQVSMSTITLHLRTEAEAPKVLPDDFGSGVAAGWQAFVAFWAGLLVVIGVLTPWLITAAIIALVIVLLVRWRISKSRADATAPPAA